MRRALTLGLVAWAIMLSLQGLPAIYFHSLFGSRGWEDGVAATGAFRTINREKLTRSRLEAELAVPGSVRQRVFTGYRSLLEARGSHAAFAPAAEQQILMLDPRVFAVLHACDEGSVLCLHNVSADSVQIDVASLIESDSPIDLIHRPPIEPMFDLGPYATAWLTAEVQ